jgi:hypothetical protein
MKSTYTDDIDTGSIKKTVNPTQGGTSSTPASEFGERSGTSVDCDGFPVDSASKKHFTKPRDLNQTEPKAKKFV